MLCSQQLVTLRHKCLGLRGDVTADPKGSTEEEEVGGETKLAITHSDRISKRYLETMRCYFGQWRIVYALSNG